jgi:hypothetical protein
VLNKFALLSRPLTIECRFLQVALVEELNPAGLPITTLLGSVGANGLARPNLWVDRVRMLQHHHDMCFSGFIVHAAASIPRRWPRRY